MARKVVICRHNSNGYHTTVSRSSIVMKTARILVTLDCNRNCSYCCNKNLEQYNYARVLSLERLNDYDEFVLSGGEPLLNPKRTINIIKYLKEEYPLTPIYLYTQTWVKGMRKILSMVDGLTYTIHHPSTKNDGLNFYCTQIGVQDTGITARLNVMDGVDTGSIVYRLDSKVWDKIRIVPVLECCPLPEHEDLLVLDTTIDLKRKGI